MCWRRCEGVANTFFYRETDGKRPLEVDRDKDWKMGTRIEDRDRYMDRQCLVEAVKDRKQNEYYGKENHVNDPSAVRSFVSTVRKLHSTV